MEKHFSYTFLTFALRKPNTRIIALQLIFRYLRTFIEYIW